MKPTAVMRELLAQPGCTMSVSAHDALLAKLVQQAGFQSISVSGSAVAAAHLGMPDMGFMNLSAQGEHGRGQEHRRHRAFGPRGSGCAARVLSGPHPLHGGAGGQRKPRPSLNGAPGGTAAIIAMRRDLLKLVRQQPQLRAVDNDFRHLLGSWFDPGFLALQQVDWNAPAALLEKIIRHEAAHEIKDWSDLRRRLQTDRRCFAFFHPQLPGGPLIFVEVALVRAIPRSIHQLINEDAVIASPREARVAAFYSISNCEPGLAGVSLGNFLNYLYDLSELEANHEQFVNGRTVTSRHVSRACRRREGCRSSVMSKTSSPCRRAPAPCRGRS